MQPIWKRLNFRIVVSAHQFSLCGALAYMWEVCETFCHRSGQPVVKDESSSSLVLSVIKTEMLLDCDDLADYCNNLENEFQSCHNKTK